MTSSAWASPPSIAHKRNAANKLYLIPQPEHDLPWFRFDSVDPVRWLAEGNVRRGTGIAGTNPPQHVAVTGDPVASPVVLSPDYRPQFELAFEYKSEDAFEERPRATANITAIQLRRDGKSDNRCSPLHFVIHRGYLRLLKGLGSDIEHGRANPSGNALLRMTYARCIIDKFIVELQAKRGLDDHGWSWRSKVLNPILQRQMNGYPDHHAPMLAVHFAGLEGSELMEKVNKFYLSRDPLEGSEQPHLRLGILYVTEARWFLSVTPAEVDSIEHYQRCEERTLKLLEKLGKEGDQEDGQEGLRESELSVIVAEGLEDYYKKDAEGAGLTDVLKDMLQERERPAINPANAG